MTTSRIEDLPDHWLTGCSNASRWVNCPGSKYADSGEDDAGFMAGLGTLGHKIVEAMLVIWSRGGKDKLTLTGVLDDADRATLAELDPTQLDWFKTACRICYDATTELAEGSTEVLFETRIKSDTIPDHGGTVDVIIWFGNLKLLIVIDFKFGSIGVDCEDNEQIMCYLNLARQRFPKATKFQGVIVQPSYNGVDVQKFTKKKLDAFRIRAAAAADPNNMDRHGDPSWCEYCPLLATCDAAAKLTVSAVDEFGTLPEFVNTVDEWTPERVERLERIVLMHKLATAAYDKASTLLKQLYADGHKLNYHRVTSGNYRSWKPSAHEQLELLYGSDIVKKSVLSPNELQKLLDMKKKDFDEAHSHMLELTSRPTLKAGVKPNAGELANDLPIFDESQA